MTDKMSTEGDSTKNIAPQASEKKETEKISESVNDAKTEPDLVSKESVNNIDAKADETASSNSKSKEDEKDDGKDVNEDKAKKAEEKNNVKAVVDEKKVVGKEKIDEKTEDENTEKDETEEDEDEKDGGGEDDEDDNETPLLDQPLEKTGKRDRKNVQRFSEENLSDSKEVLSKVEFPEGSGASLGSIPHIDASISRFKNDDLQLLHRILFKGLGKATMIKRNIKKFNGFDFRRTSDDFKKKSAILLKFELKQLKIVCEMLELSKTGQKEDIAERIIDFLMEPKDSGKVMVGSGGRPKRTAAVRANNRGYSSHDNYSSDERHSGSAASDEDFEPSDDGSDEKPPVKRKRSERRKVEESDDDDDDEELSELESSEDDSDDDQKSKRKKVVVKANNKPKGTGKRGRPPTVNKKVQKGGKKRNKESSDDDDEEEEEEESDQKDEGGSSSEDEPLAKKAKVAAQPPTDDDIKTYVKQILEGANLEEITMKTVCQQVYAHYPDFDLTHKKDFIKSTVKSLIST